MGAALLAARACLSGGAGLTTVSIPESGLTALNTSLPEVMYLDRAELNFTEAEFEKFKQLPSDQAWEQELKVKKYWKSFLNCLSR